MNATPIPTLDGLMCWRVGVRDETDDLAEQPGSFAVKMTFDDPDQARNWLQWILANHPQYRAQP